MNQGIIPSTDLSAQEIAEMRKVDVNMKNRLLWDDTTYFADTSMVSNSHLKELEKGGPRSLMNYLNQAKAKKKQTEAQIYGSAFHCAVLEPDELYKRFFVLDDAQICKSIGGKSPRSTNDYKAWKSAELLKHGGKQELDLSDYTDIMNLKDRVYSIPQCRQLLEHTLKEVVYFRNIEGVMCKCKADGLRVNQFGLELKSMKDAPTLSTFSYTVNSLDYDRAAAFYKDILDVPEMHFIAAEKTYPHNIGVFTLSKETYMIGKAKYLHALRTYKSYFGKEREEKFNEQTFFFSGTV